MASHVPPELRAITAYLRDKGRLRTPGLFVNSADAAMLWAMHQPPEVGTPDNNREPKSGCALAVRQVREALDRGQEVPRSYPDKLVTLWSQYVVTLPTTLGSMFDAARTKHSAEHQLCMGCHPMHMHFFVGHLWLAVWAPVMQRPVVRCTRRSIWRNPSLMYTVDVSVHHRRVINTVVQ